MTRSVPFKHIIKAKANRADLQVDWHRQRTTASKLIHRFERGYDSVLLADEVGMGKTYVAMAVMADKLMQSRVNKRKVLLIVPPSHVLRHKWIEDIDSFNSEYVLRTSDRNKQMRPLNLNSYWDLFRNLRNFQNAPDITLNKPTLLAFLMCFFEWAKSRRLLGGRKQRWVLIQSLDPKGLDYLGFVSHYSVAALRDFLDDKYRSYSAEFRQYFTALKDGHIPTQLPELLKKFAMQQGSFRPNIFVMSMRALKAPAIDESDNRLFSEFVAGLLMSGLHQPTRERIVKALEAAEVVRKRPHRMRKEAYVDMICEISAIDLYGLRDVTLEVLNRKNVDANWTALRKNIENTPEKIHDFFEKIRDEVFQKMLKMSKFELAVIDEVHNWKGEKHGAKDFEAHYAQAIPHKLIMSATPFQVEEAELKRVFSFVADSRGKSAAVLDAIFEKDSGVIHRCLKASEAFSAAWQQLPQEPDNSAGSALLNAASVDDIRALAAATVKEGDFTEPMPVFSKALLNYRTTIDALQRELHKVVIRHTKPRIKRDFCIGQEFHVGHADGQPRTALYPSNGYANEDAAMVNFIGMRLGQIVSRSQHGTKAKAHLLNNMTSSTAAFLNGKKGIRRGQSAAAGYSDMFFNVLSATTHPKVKATLEHAFDNFRQGRKTLIFCERKETIKELVDGLNQRILELNASQTNDSKSTTRRNFLRRTELVDNLWWVSLGDATAQGAAFFALSETHAEDAERFVRTCLEDARAPLSARRIIRLLDVYLLARAMEHDPALLQRGPASALMLFAELYRIFQDASNPQRVSLLKEYLHSDSDKKKDLDHDESVHDVQAILRRQYHQRQNLWCAEVRPDFHGVLWALLDSEAQRLGSGAESMPAVKEFIPILQELMQGLGKVALRNDLIARYEAAETEGTHLARISKAFSTMKVGHAETMLSRIQRFLKGLLAENGSISQTDQRDSKRKSMWSGVHLADGHEHVTMLHGETNVEKRRRICASFNSPLQPEILICSAIGSEGIDLHRHCADIIHHDLPWNPAKLEQRIGRLDRVNSLADPGQGIRLTIGIPFLANNYDKYQYDKVFARAQKFEVLLGTPAFQHSDIDEEKYTDNGAELVCETEDAAPADVGEALRVLPDAIIQFLKVNLSVVPRA